MTQHCDHVIMTTPSKRPRAASYRDLDAWKVAMDLVTEVYTVTRTFPDHERYGLTSQLRRAAVSVPANIAEGNRRPTRTDYRRFVGIARASVAEIDTELEIARRLGFVQDEELARTDELTTRVGQMLTRLGQSLGE